MEIPVFYNPAMVVERPMESPSPRKPAEVVSEWVGSLSVRVMGFEPLGVEDFCLAHDRAHVMGILDLSIANGMDTKDQDVADTLGWTTGSFYAAASHALEHGVAASPTSGFHHAGHAFS